MCVRMCVGVCVCVRVVQGISNHNKSTAYKLHEKEGLF